MPAVSISIPQPCTQLKGKSADRGIIDCDHCQKEVVDYTGMTDAELLAHIKRHGMGCGRFRREQLDREMKPHDFRKSHFLGRWVVSLLLLSAWVKDAQAQQRRITPDTVQTIADQLPGLVARQPQKDTAAKPVAVSSTIYIVDGIMLPGGSGAFLNPPQSWWRRTRTDGRNYITRKWFHLRYILGNWF